MPNYYPRYSSNILHGIIETGFARLFWLLLCRWLEGTGVKAMFFGQCLKDRVGFGCTFDVYVQGVRSSKHRAHTLCRKAVDPETL